MMNSLHNPLKLHIGSGTVYLQNFINVDMPTDHCFLAEERQDLVNLYITNEELGYYHRHKEANLDGFKKGAKVQEYVCDRYGSFTQLPARSGTIAEILARQSFEHMSITEARRALVEMNRVLMIGGIIRLDVPDNDETLKKLVETGDWFYIRHMLGPRLGDFGNHCVSYTKDGLYNLAAEYGFVASDPLFEDNIHPYPAFTLRMKKSKDL